MAVGVEQHVVRFDVAMNVAQPVDRSDRQHLKGKESPLTRRIQHLVRVLILEIFISTRPVNEQSSFHVNHFLKPYHFGNVEFGHILGKPVFIFGEEREQVASAIIVHDEVKVVLVLEGKMQLGDPLLITVYQNVTLLEK